MERVAVFLFFPTSFHGMIWSYMVVALVHTFREWVVLFPEKNSSLDCEKKDES